MANERYDDYIKAIWDYYEYPITEMQRYINSLNIKKDKDLIATSQAELQGWINERDAASKQIEYYKARKTPIMSNFPLYDKVWAPFISQEKSAKTVREQEAAEQFKRDIASKGEKVNPELIRYGDKYYDPYSFKEVNQPEVHALLAKYPDASSPFGRQPDMQQGFPTQQGSTSFQYGQIGLRPEEQDAWAQNRADLASATGPENWITRHLLSQYQPRQVNVRQEKLEQVSEALAIAEQQQKDIPKGTAAAIRGHEQLKALRVKYDAAYDAQMEAKSEQNWSGAGAASNDWMPDISREKAIAMGMSPQEWGKYFGSFRTPAAPDWLAELSPKNVAGFPIVKENIITPSMQWWNKASPTRRSELGGFLDWNKQSREDVFARMESMIPWGTVQQSKRWSPVSQRA